jgi:hypothetical protein
MLLKIYQANNNELKASFNITFLKKYIKKDKITDILGFIESLDPIIQELQYENKPIDYRVDIIRDLNNLPLNHSLDDIVDILRTYKKKYQDKDEEQINDQTIEQIRLLQKQLIPYTWYHYGIIDDNSYYLFAYQDNKFPFKAVLLPIKHIPVDVKERFDRLYTSGEFIKMDMPSMDYIDRNNLSYFMKLVDNSPSNYEELFQDEQAPEWIEKCKFTYKPLYNWVESRNEYTMLKNQNDVEKSIFLS